mgnify:CR=1 FL=1
MNKNIVVVYCLGLRDRDLFAGLLSVFLLLIEIKNVLRILYESNWSAS